MRNPFHRNTEPAAVKATAVSKPHAAVNLLQERTFRATTPEKHTEVYAMVTVGEEHARILSKKLGRVVRPGEQFDLGLVAGGDPDPITNALLQREANEHHIFNDPIE